MYAPIVHHFEIGESLGNAYVADKLKKDTQISLMCVCLCLVFFSFTLSLSLFDSFDLLRFFSSVLFLHSMYIQCNGLCDFLCKSFFFPFIKGVFCLVACLPASAMGSQRNYSKHFYNVCAPTTLAPRIYCQFLSTRIIKFIEITLFYFFFTFAQIQHCKVFPLL